MLQIAVLLLWIVFLTATSILAWKARNLELRIAATVCVVGYLLTILAENLNPHWSGPQIGVLFIDSGAALVLGYLNFRRPAAWVIAASGFQFAAVGLHVAYLLASRFRSSGYILGLILISFLVVLSVAVGAIWTLMASRRLLTPTPVETRDAQPR